MKDGVDQLKGVIEDLLGIDPESTTGLIIDGTIAYGGMITPFIGPAINYMKFRRIEARLQNHSVELAELRDLLNALDGNFQQFIRDKVFPLVIENIYEETQEDKIGVIINGLTGVIKNKITDEDLIITYFDVLNQIRTTEIQHLFTNYDNRTRDRLDMSLLELALDRSREGRKKYAELQGFQRYVDNKLLRLGLINYKQDKKKKPSLFQDYNSPKEDKEHKWILDEYALSDFGRQFIAFFESNK